MAAASEAGPPWAPGKVNLWTKIMEHNKVQARQSGDQGRPDANLYFVGSKAAGKSTLLNRFLYPDKTETPKPTDGMEYTYARKSVNHDRKDISHIWEVAGSDELCEEVTLSENLFLGMRQVATAVVCVVVDLSQPAEVLPTLEFWLDKIKSKTGATYEKLERRGSKLPEQLKLRAKKVFGATHEDKDSVLHTGISLVIVATKYDLFRDMDAEVKKIMARTLRFYAHTHGACLVYTGGLASNKPIPPEHSKEYAGLRDNLRALLHHLVFTGPDRKIAAKLQQQLDHMGALVVAAGTDRLKDIGRPRGGAEASSEGAIGEWRAVFQKLFPPKKKEGKKEWVVDQKQYAEQLVDNVVAQKNAEVVAYKKQLQINREMVARQAAAQRAASQKRAAPPPARKPPS